MTASAMVSTVWIMPSNMAWQSGGFWRLAAHQRCPRRRLGEHDRVATLPVVGGEPED
jgi:hypothetical protein